MKTFVAMPEKMEKKWYLVDATGKTLGRLASRLAFRLRGKHKPEFTSHVDTGDCFIVVHAEKLIVTGKKAKNKMYHRHSSYPGGMKSESFEKLQARRPTSILESAVKGMLPKGPLGREMFRHLKVYTGGKHPHTAQHPELINL